MKLEAIGIVRRIDQATARIELDDTHHEGLAGLLPGTRLDVLYWMHELPESERRAAQVHPRGDKNRPTRGVFALRSPMRPNPIGVSVVTVVDIRHNRLLVKGLDAHDGSPILDIKAARQPDETAQLLEMWGQVHQEMVSALQTELGETLLQRVLRSPMRKAGRATARDPLDNAGEIGRAILAIESLWGIEGHIVEDSPDRFTREVTTCPWSFFVPLGCDIFAWWMEGFVRGCNGEYNYSLEKSIPRGDAACVWSVYKSALER